jgi:hypothetical protein
MAQWRTTAIGTAGVTEVGASSGTRARTKAGLAVADGASLANRLYERGPVVKPRCFGGTERGCEGVSPDGMDAGGAPGRTGGSMARG